jgi:GGDEF domain-containing protein
VRPDQLIGRHAFELTPGEAAREAITRALAGESASATVGDGEVTFDVSWQPVLDGGQLAAIAIDVDGFKTVNDSLGHAAGDDVLRELARRLSGVAEEHGAFLARQGADEFTLLISEREGRRCARRPSGSPTRRSRSSASRSPRAGRRPAARLVRRGERRRARAPDAHRPDPGRAGQRGALPALPADPGPARRALLGRRGAHPLERPGARARVAGRVHPGRRGLRPHRRHRALGRRRGVPPMARVGRRRVGDRDRDPGARDRPGDGRGRGGRRDRGAARLPRRDGVPARAGLPHRTPDAGRAVTEYLRLHGPAATHSQLRSAA